MGKKLMIILGGLVGLIVLLIICGMIFESIASHNVTKKFPPSGDFVKVNGQHLHVKTMGKTKGDGPPVIIEAGTGNWSYDWSIVQKELSKYTQVITYDRAGYGYSDPSDSSFSASNVVNDLHGMIQKEHIQKPFILIGHSTGGIYTRLYADKYPESVAGMVLVDSRNLKFTEQFPKFNKKFFETQGQTMNKLLSEVGLTRIIGEKFVAPNFPKQLSKDKYTNVLWDADFFNTLEKKQLR